jgi:hypothetical protein
MEASRTNGISIVAFVPGGQELGQGDLSGVLAQRPDALDRAVDLLLPAMSLGHQARDGAAVVGDDDGLAALDVIEELGQMGFGLGDLDFTHGGHRLDWSIRLPQRAVMSTGRISTTSLLPLPPIRAWQP